MSMGRRFLMISEAASSGRSRLAEAHARLFTVGESTKLECRPPSSEPCCGNLHQGLAALCSKIDLGVTCGGTMRRKAVRSQIGKRAIEKKPNLRPDFPARPCQGRIELNFKITNESTAKRDFVCRAGQPA